MYDLDVYTLCQKIKTIYFKLVFEAHRFTCVSLFALLKVVGGPSPSIENQKNLDEKISPVNLSSESYLV